MENSRNSSTSLGKTKLSSHLTLPITCQHQEEQDFPTELKLKHVEEDPSHIPTRRNKGGALAQVFVLPAALHNRTQPATK